MENDNVKKREFHSMQEYIVQFFPDDAKKDQFKSDDPANFGMNLALESLEKIKQQLSKR